jgi:ABC-type multidrug transport system ATPase subunit
MNDMLQLIDLSKSYDHRTYAVKGLSVEVQDGHILALLGHNGAGKSTTLKMVSTMLEPTTGQVLIDGINLFQTSTERLRQIKRKIGFVSEATNLLGYLTAWEYLFYIGQMYGIDDDRFLRKRIDELVEQFVITDAEEKYIDEFSSGLKKRIAIASMMVNTPTLLLLDEPTAHLDPIGVKMLKDYLKELRSGGNTVVLATHNLDIAEQLADEILIINEGEKMFYGTLDDLSQRFEASDGQDNLESFYSQLMAKQ